MAGEIDEKIWFKHQLLLCRFRLILYKKQKITKTSQCLDLFSIPLTGTIYILLSMYCFQLINSVLMYWFHYRYSFMLRLCYILKILSEFAVQGRYLGYQDHVFISKSGNHFIPVPHMLHGYICQINWTLHCSLVCMLIFTNFANILRFVLLQKLGVWWLHFLKIVAFLSFFDVLKLT